MRWYLHPGTLDNNPKFDITEAEYEKIRSASALLTCALRTEERFEICKRYFYDLELEILAITLENKLDRDFSYERFFENRLKLEKATFGFVTAAKHVIEKLASDFSSNHAEAKEIKQQIKGFLSAEYDTSFEYRFVEALRNHILHHGGSVHGYSTSASKPDPFNSPVVNLRLSFTANKSKISENSGFKKTVLNEMPESVELKSALRVYMAAISRVFARSRDLRKLDITAARDTVTDAISRYSTFCGTPQRYVTLYSENGGDLTKTQLLTDWDDQRIRLWERNPEMSNLSNVFLLDT
ncbi:hypothetical protein V3390_01905 [Luteimonas sp. FXH3W]|uniref:Uncharacterized protein n=1 Tax=Aquilutibacter rugosus TaxID=3115820 RepID=A0ABU7UX53_9GAMM